ncbi:MAG: hypothetical protein AAF721_18080 [Myxococcota bacterium]
MVDRQTQAQIESLLHELRSWPAHEVRAGRDELARRFRLDPMIVDRLAQAEGIDLGTPEEGAPVSRSRDRVTAVIELGDEPGRDRNQ